VHQLATGRLDRRTCVAPDQRRGSAELKAAPAEPSPAVPSPAVPLAPGNHDIGLAGTVWLRVGDSRALSATYHEGDRTSPTVCDTYLSPAETAVS
jgi:hypothetical protein